MLNSPVSLSLRSDSPTGFCTPKPLGAPSAPRIPVLSSPLSFPSQTPNPTALEDTARGQVSQLRPERGILGPSYFQS